MAVSILGSMLILLWVSWPILAPGGSAGNREDELLVERTQMLLASLKKLKQSAEEQSLAEDDLKNIEHRIMLDLAKVYRKRGIDPDGANAQVSEDRDQPQPTQGFCVKCGQKRETRFVYCPKCGIQYIAA